MKAYLDWLLAIPDAENWSEQQKKAQELVDADPAAAAISEVDAASFFSVAEMLRYAKLKTVPTFFRRFGVHVPRLNEPNIRRGIRAVLRLWRQKSYRDLMIQLQHDMHSGGYPDAKAGTAYWTRDRFVEAIADPDANLVWLINVARCLGVMEDAEAWLEAHGGAERVGEYRFWVNVGRLTMRQIVYPETPSASPGQGDAAAAAIASPEDLTVLKEIEQKATALRQNVRRLERDRKKLKEQHRQVEREIKADLAQARGEVAAARRSLEEFLAAHRAASAEQERRFEREQAALAKQISEARAAYARTLRQQQVVPVLAGRTVQVTGAQGDMTAVQAQVESLGARIAQPGEKADAIVDASGGLGALEAQLRTFALRDIHIKCDGNWRRKMGRHGISNAAFEVLLGERPIYQEGRPVCCGPLTSPIMSEYAAIIMALAWVARMKPAPQSQVLIWSDCKFLVDHINGRWRLDPARGCAMLDHLLVRLLRRVERLGYRVSVTWVPRAHVYAMDRLCAATYYAVTWYHRWKKGERAPTLPLEQFIRSV